MDFSLSKLPGWAQIAAFVLVSAGAAFGFWTFYVADMQVDIESRQTRLKVLRGDIAKGNATARQLAAFQREVADLESRLESLRAVLPEQQDVAEILRGVEVLAKQSNLRNTKFTPQEPKQQPLYAEWPLRLHTEGTYHNLGTFFDRVSKFPRIINVTEITIKPKPQPEANSTILAEYTATTFVLQEAPPPPTGRGAAPPPAK